MIWIIDSWEGQVVNRAPDEHDQIGWFRAADLESLDLVDQALFDLVHDALGSSKPPASPPGSTSR